MIHPNIFDHIGFWSPLLLVLAGLYKLHDTIWLKPIFISLVIANIIINKLLKATIQQPRPENSHNLYDFEDYSGEERYGMPSGHAELSTFSVIYVYLVKQSKTWLNVGAFLILLTCVQRWRYQLHSIPQLIAGVCVGAALGILMHKLTKQILKKYNL